MPVDIKFLFEGDGIVKYWKISNNLIHETRLLYEDVGLILVDLDKDEQLVGVKLVSPDLLSNSTICNCLGLFDI